MTIYSIAKEGVKWSFETSPELVNAYSHRIINRRKRLGYSQRDLAKMVGVSVNTIQSYESGCLPRGEHFLNLARSLNCSLDWLVGLNGGGLSWPTTVDNDDHPQLNQNGLVWNEPRSWVYPQFLTENSSQANVNHPPVSFAHQWLSTIVSEASQARLFVVKGPAMNPTFYDGDLCLVDANQTQVHQGQVYVIKLDERLFVNRLEARPNGILRIISDNKDIAPPYEVEAKNVLIQGQVVWNGRLV